MEDTKVVAEKLELMENFLEIVEKHRGAYKQERIFNRVVALVMAELFTFGRHTITQLLLALGITDDDWSAWYRIFSHARHDEELVGRIILGEYLSEVKAEEPFVVGADGFQVPRSSKKMPGTAWLKGLGTAPFRPGLHRAQRFVEGSWLPPVVRGYTRALPIRCLPAFTSKAVPSEHEAKKEWEVGLEFLKWTRAKMDACGREKQTLMTLNDGSYDTLGFWPGLPERTVALVRTARNRRLYYLPGPQPASKPGPDPQYGEQAPPPYTWLQKRKGFKRKTITIRGRQRPMRYRVEGPFVRETLPDIPLFLIVIGGGRRPTGSRRKNYKPCFFLVHAVLDENGQWTLPLPIAELLTWLWQRWELEVAHRQMKSGLGLGEKQCWNPKATVASVQWSAWVYAMLLLAGYRTWGNDPGPAPPGRWRSRPKRWSFNTLIRAFRAELWQKPRFQATWTGTRDNWLQFETLWASFLNTSLASARI